MQMNIHNHKLKDAKWMKSPNHGGFITPVFIVMHYTAGYTAESAVSTLCKTDGASAHVVIDRDGSITQLVPFNVKAWHAGPSQYQGHDWLNNCSIGIELVGIGWYRKLEDG